MSQFYKIGGFARARFLSLAGIQNQPVLDLDLMIISSDPDPELNLDQRADVQVCPSLEDFYSSRDCTLNQCAVSPSGELVASREAIHYLSKRQVKQTESGSRAALRTLRFGTISGLQSLVNRSDIEEATEWDVAVQFLRANQAGFGSQYRKALRYFGYRGRIALPDFAFGQKTVRD